MMELHQFKHSAFCLKARMALDAKKIKYKKVEIHPGIGQIKIFRLSGQRQVPVLKDGENIISDSSAILQYLDKVKPLPILFPENPIEAAQVHIIEDWADTTFANTARKLLILAASQDPELRIALLPDETPTKFRQIFENLPLEAINNFSGIINQGDDMGLLESLKKISNLLSINNWLVGDSISAADISIAAQLSLLRFPLSSGDSLAGKGCPGFYDHPEIAKLFNWRDELENYIKNTNCYEEQELNDNDLN